MDRIVLETAVGIATRYLNDLPSRHVGATATHTQLLEALGGPLPEGGSDPVMVLEQLARNAEPGLVASAGPRYFGFVTGGALPVTVGADWIANGNRSGILGIEDDWTVAGRVASRWRPSPASEESRKSRPGAKARTKMNA